MTDKKSSWALGLRLLALLTALAIIYYWFWYLPAQSPAPTVHIEFTP
ncbi:MAG: hypothetical protein P3X24_000045 [bacterium]|nr:hypothetical protein [bacterium]